MGLQDRDYMKERLRAALRTPNPRGNNSGPPNPAVRDPLQSYISIATTLCVGIWLLAGYLFFQRSALPLPPTGIYQVYPGGQRPGQPAPLRVKAQSPNHHNYLVKISDWSTDQPVMTMFVRDGEEAEATLPVGTYRLKFAEGSQWRGDKALFGMFTRYTQSANPVMLKPTATGTVGVVLYLSSHLNGNFTTQPSSFQ